VDVNAGTIAHGSSKSTAPVVEAVDLYRFFHAGDDETLALRVCHSGCIEVRW